MGRGGSSFLFPSLTYCSSPTPLTLPAPRNINQPPSESALLSSSPSQLKIIKTTSQKISPSFFLPFLHIPKNTTLAWHGTYDERFLKTQLNRKRMKFSLLSKWGFYDLNLRQIFLKPHACAWLVRGEGVGVFVVIAG